MLLVLLRTFPDSYYLIREKPENFVNLPERLSPSCHVGKQRDPHLLQIIVSVERAL